jgi:hypothetical protein
MTRHNKNKNPTDIEKKLSEHKKTPMIYLHVGDTMPFWEAGGTHMVAIHNWNGKFFLEIDDEVIEKLKTAGMKIDPIDVWPGALRAFIEVKVVP